MLTFASSLHQLANHLNTFAPRGGTVICTSHVYQRHFTLTTGNNFLLASYFDECHAVKITPDKQMHVKCKVFGIGEGIIFILFVPPQTLPIKTDFMHSILFHNFKEYNYKEYILAGNLVDNCVSAGNNYKIVHYIYAPLFYLSVSVLRVYSYPLMPPIIPRLEQKSSVCGMCTIFP